jgi:predicted nucleic acid-binding protein
MKNTTKFAVVYTDSDTNRRRVLGTNLTRKEALTLRDKKVERIAVAMGLDEEDESSMISTVRSSKESFTEWNGHLFEILPVK